MSTLFWSLVVVGCGGGDGIDFPNRLGPLEADNLASWPKGSGDDAYPETLSVVSGKDDDEDRFWAHGRGFVQADLAHVWAAARVIEVNVDRREVDSWSVTFDTVPEFEVSYTIHNEVDDVIDVNYDTTWVHEQQGGDAAATLQVVARWDKTDGTTFIDLLAGSMVLEQVEPGVTSVELQEHLRAALRDEQTLESYLDDLFTELVAETHGEPLPNY